MELEAEGMREIPEDWEFPLTALFGIGLGIFLTLFTELMLHYMGVWKWP